MSSSSSLELNKIVGAVLVAGIVAMVCGTLAGMLVKPHHAEHEAVAAGEGGGGAAKPAGPAPIEPVSGLLANADPAKGQEVAKKCLTCHTFGKGEPAKVGPNLYGIVGNKHGHMEGFSYSTAISSIDKPWGYEEINHFITNPRAYAPGTKMSFAGLPKVEDRANVIAYLRTLSDNPVPLPTQDEIDAANKAYEDAKAAAAAPPPSSSSAAPVASTTQEAAAPADDSAQVVGMIASADPAKGQDIAKKCAVCHSFGNGEKAKVGPNLYGIVGNMHAHMEGFSYSDAMKNTPGTWDYAALAHYLLNPKAAIPGNKMAFAGLKKPEDRAAVIAYLRTLSDNPVPLP
ncbi:c-type cytochrome [Hypericibacter sp.]|uniref:c-type cytochrome n=1 Tax=Hypericibacter sp. TaxID=2705401 RepID=UPI003D6CD6D2